MDSARTRSIDIYLGQHSMFRKTLILIFLLLPLFMFSQVLAADQNTLFLPLKINSLEKKSEFVESIDSALKTALSQKGLIMLDRSQAESLADYNKAWPPPVTTLKKIARDSDAHHIISGSLTFFGNQLSLDIKIFDPLTPTTATYYTKQGNDLAQLPSLLNQIVNNIIAYTNREFIIASIAPKGNTRIDSGAILRKLQSKPGDAYNPSKLKEDLKAIYKMGYFDDVQIDVEESSKGKNVLFILVEKPVISSITFSGIDKLEEEKIQEAVTIKEQSILNPGKVKESVASLKEIYREKGYYNTQITPKLSFPTRDSVALEYVIIEGKKIFIKRISFDGNKAFDDDDLEDIIETEAKDWLSWLTDDGLLDNDKITQDSNRIVSHYHNHGYLDAKVGKPSIKQKGKWLYISFSVEEGPRYLVGTVDVDGELISEKKDFIDLLTIRDEEFMSRKIIREDSLKLTDYYAEHGYAFATIRPNFRKSASGKRIDILFQVTKGDLVYINRIVIRGNTRTRDNVIRRDLKVAEGGIFDSKAIRESTQKLQRLNFFEEVSVSPEPTLDPAKLDVTVDVKEKSTGQFSIGAGYSSVDKFVVMGEISENNFLGRGDKLSFSSNLGGTSSRFNLAYTNPRLNDSQLSWGIDLFNWEREYDDYTKESKGGTIRLGYPLWEKWRIFGSYGFSDTELSDIADDASNIIKESAKINLTSAIKLSLKRDTRNKLFNATSGSENILSIKFAGGPLGGDSQFTKIEGSTSWYYPLFFGSAFHVKGAAGQAFEHKDAGLPIYERFFLGGLRTIRGFEYAKVSPKDPDTDERIGGDKMWYTNIEVIFPIIAKQGIHGVFFLDAGQVFDDHEAWGFDDFKKAAGVGLRWISPIGPLRIAWGFNLDPEEDEEDAVWDFSMGGYF